MVAFEVRVNGKRRCLAGVGQWGGLWTNLGRTRERRGSRGRGRRRTPGGQVLTLGVSGFIGDLARSGEHVRWMDETLRVGDRVSVTVLDTDRIDAPAWRHQEDPALVERAERRQYLRLKRRYERGRQPTTRRTRRRRGR